MESNRNSRRNYISYEEYVQGNTVRKQAVEPERKENIRENRRERVYVDNQRVTTSRRAMRNREKALQMSLPYVVILGVCLIIMAGLCGKYLMLKSDVSEVTSQIAAQEVSANSLKAKNDSKEYDINSFKDVENITNQATTRLGMVKATQDQVIFYNSSESEYMKQYKEIPQD